MTTTAEPIAPEGVNRSYAPDRYTFGDEPGLLVTILGSRSEETGSLFWPRRLRCPETGGTVRDVELATDGVLWSWTFVSAPWPGEIAPNGLDGYAVGLVDLDDHGPRVVGVLVGNGHAWTVGQRMRACELHFATVEGTPRSILAFEAVEK